MSGTNGWDIVTSMNQDLLTELVQTEFNKAIDSGMIPDPILINGTSVEYDNPNATILTNPATENNWANCLDLTLDLTLESTTGTLDVATNIEEIFLGTVSQPRYLSVDGNSSSYADCGTLSDSLPSSGCTFMTWLNLQSYDAQGILKVANSNGMQLLISLSDNQPSLWYDGKTYTYTPYSYQGKNYPDFTLGTWHHLAVVIDASDSSDIGVTFYVDGQPQKTVQMSSWKGIETVDLLVGKQASSESIGALNGKTTGASVWQSALSSGEIRQYMNADLTTNGLDTSLGCLGYWLFDPNDMWNLLNDDEAVTTYGGAAGESEDDPGYQTYLYFASDDADDIFVVSNTVSNDTVSSQINNYVTGILARKVSMGAVSLGSSPTNEVPIEDSDQSIWDNPSLIQFITETETDDDGDGDWSNPDQLLFLVMMNNYIPPDIDNKSEFADDSAVVIPSEDNSMMIGYDYFIFTMAAAKMEEDGWSATVDTDPVQLVAKKGPTKLTVSIADGQGVKVEFKTETGLLANDVWKIDASLILTFTVETDGQGNTYIKMEPTHVNVSVSANQQSSVVISFEVLVSILSTFAPFLGALCWSLALSWKAIMVGIVTSKIKGKSKEIPISEYTNFQLDEIAFEDGVAVYGVLTPVGAVITGLSPTSGKPGDVVTLTGQGFIDKNGETLLSEAELGGQSGLSLKSVSGTPQQGTATVAVPLGGTGLGTPVKVKDKHGNWSNAFGSFVVKGTKAPSQVQLQDTSGVAGDAVIMTGTGFTGTTEVSFNGNDAPSFTVVSDTEISATVPLNPTAGQVTVTNNVGSAASSNRFTPTPAPVIYTVTGPSGSMQASPGDTLTITGDNFITREDQPVQVIFSRGSTLLTDPVDASGSETEVTVTVPEGCISGLIYVKTAAGTSGGKDFTIVGDATPTITSFSPTEGKSTDQVTVSGSNFSGASTAKIGGQICSFYLASPSGDSQLILTVNRLAQSGQISVDNGAGVGTSTDTFEIIAKPSISAIQPTSGEPGSKVTVYGSNFTDGSGDSVVESLYISGQEATVDTVESQQLVAEVPSGTTGKAAAMKLTTYGGSTLSSQTFTVLGTTTPVIKSFSPDSGGVGAEVTVKGEDFTGTVSVALGSVDCTYEIVSDSELTFKVAADVQPGSYPIVVRPNSAASGSSSTKFEVTAT